MTMELYLFDNDNGTISTRPGLHIGAAAAAGIAAAAASVAAAGISAGVSASEGAKNRAASEQAQAMQNANANAQAQDDMVSGMMGIIADDGITAPAAGAANPGALWDVPMGGGGPGQGGEGGQGGPMEMPS